MFKKTKKIIALFICILMILPVIASCGAGGVWRGQSEGTVVVASTEFNEVFSPVFYTTAYDGNIAGLVHTATYKLDRNAGLTDLACKYQAPKEFKGDDGETWVKYTYTLKDNVNFSDGTPVTADDIIFTYKLYLDPAYDGLSTLFTLPILGLKEYRYDDPDYAAVDKRINDEADVKVNDPEWMLQWLVDTYGPLGYTAEDLAPYVDDEEDKADAKNEVVKELMAEYIETKLAGGVSVPDISGIKKVNNKTVEVTLTGVDPTAELSLAISIIPEHYYGKDYKKGDLTGVKKLNGKPMGAGPYMFESFENNVVSLIANPEYFEGTPRIERLVYQVTDTDNRFEVVENGDADISDPPASPEMVQRAKDAGLHYELIDNNGYGYIGINSDRVPDKNVRKALMHLMNRGPAVEAAYGELAEIIERPMSKVSWAYPTKATEYYGYDKDKALDYFKAAGYTQDGGKLVKNGEQFSIELWLSSSDHPVVPVFTQMKTDLESLGAVCNIISTDWGVYNENYRAGLIDIWAAAWGGGVDPDMYQIYNSSQVESGNNPYHIRNSELDKLIEDGVATVDKAKRAEIYAKALDIVMEEACEMPFYQRKNMYLIQQENVDIESLPDDMTPYYEWDAEIEKLRTVAQAEAE